MSRNTNANSVLKSLETFTDNWTPSYNVSNNIAIDDFTPSTSSTNGTFYDYFKNITFQTWIIIILLLALLGFNIFAFLAKGTQETASIFNKIIGPIVKMFSYSTLETTKQTIDVSATGAKAGIDVVADTTTDMIDSIEQHAMQIPSSTTGTSTNVSTIPISSQMKSTNQGMPVQQQMQQGGGNYQDETLQRALDNASQVSNTIPDNSLSEIQASNNDNKAGWCYVGEDRGYRSCAEVGVNDVCMSGNIFPTQEVCMNPALRA